MPIQQTRVSTDADLKWLGCKAQLTKILNCLASRLLAIFCDFLGSTQSRKGIKPGDDGRKADLNELVDLGELRMSRSIYEDSGLIASYSIYIGV